MTNAHIPREKGIFWNEIPSTHPLSASKGIIWAIIFGFSIDIVILFLVLYLVWGCK